MLLSGHIGGFPSDLLSPRFGPVPPLPNAIKCPVFRSLANLTSALLVAPALTVPTEYQDLPDDEQQRPDDGDGHEVRQH